MTIASEITRLQWAKADIKTAIENKWVTVPSATKLDGYSSLIDAIPTTIPDYLCFTANTASSTITLNKNGSPTSVTLETSTDGVTWTTYTFWTTITLSNVWDKVYWRNTSETNTWFSSWEGNHYQFAMTWSIAWSWDIWYLLNKNSTISVWNMNFCMLFRWCTSLTTSPKLTATTLSGNCYYHMFWWCSWLTVAPELPATDCSAGTCYNYMFRDCSSLIIPPKLPATKVGIFSYSSMFMNCSNLICIPKLPATNLTSFSYHSMFQWCSKIRLSTTQTWDYQTAYRIPTTWTASYQSNSLQDMFKSTWWTFTWTPTIHTTYYTSNAVV